ncbi:MAG TPA: response regulator [Pyrinomonadaceae bacterium]|nr:response regulator [Pyrinomonadaceae bacterium]
MALILIVDDDETIRDMLYDLFESEHKCHSAETAEQALAWLGSESYDVVLTDISMPGLSGIELLGHIKQHQPDTPVIIISGMSDKEQAQGLLKMGAFDYLVKPFRLQGVEESVGRALEERKRVRGGESRSVSGED